MTDWPKETAEERVRSLNELATWLRGFSDQYKEDSEEFLHLRIASDVIVAQSEDYHDLRVSRAFRPDETDLHLLAAHTPTHYAGDYPPIINLTMLRMKGDVVLAVRAPTVHGAPAGDCASVRFTREQWRDFVALVVDPANKVFEACDSLDAIL